MKELHLICESHIDPVWLWEWEEGASAAIATFQSAANLADQFDYIFCHNEVTLYQYIEEYAPALFAKIKQLIAAGKWHIMGGWYLQPDCNMPSGESFVRQIQVGKKYFKDRFGAEPSTAVNFDSFGHSRGLVQIIKKCGQDSYIFCRPFAHECTLPDNFFTWKGYDGSEISAFRSPTYNSQPFGNAANHINAVKNSAEDRDVWLCLWGVGNHGGGPSRKDLRDIEELIRTSDTKIIHSTPEAFFKSTAPSAVHDKSLLISMPGCYTSVSELKRRHIALENNLYAAEKQMSAAALSGLCDYPQESFDQAVEDLLGAEFHDILPGTAIKKGIENGIRMMQRGMQMAEKARAKAFFALSQNERPAEEGEYPILVFNPHPYAFSEKIEVEFNLADQNYDLSKESFIHIYDGDRELACQQIREDSNLLLDWRKRVIFEAELLPLAVKRFSAFVEFVPRKGEIPQPEGDIVFDNGEKYVRIDRRTGLMVSYQINGKEYLAGGAFAPVLYEDNEDPWGMQGFQHEAMGRSPQPLPLSKTDSGVFRGRKNINIVEDGPVVLSVESFFESDHVGVRVLYNIYKEGRDVDVKVNVLWNEKNRMLKLHIPTVFENAAYFGQSAFGSEELFSDGRECVSHRFVCTGDSPESRLAVINNCIYGSSFSKGEIRLSLLRGAQYSGHPIDNRLPEIGPDRYVSIIDQGEHEYNFRLTISPEEELERRALEFNQRPFAMNIFPTGDGKAAERVRISQSNPNITASAIKKSETGEGYIVRLFNGTGKPASTDFSIGDADVTVDFGKYEVKTLTYHDGKFTVGEEMKI